jgi:hypothetical protein
MRNAKVLLCATLFMAAFGWAMLTVSGPTAANQKEVAGSHWRHHDGHWSYWHDGDRRWYYTDGSNWFYNGGAEGTPWTVYGFDKQFGREGFVKGDYRTPVEGAKITAPKHGIYRAPGK